METANTSIKGHRAHIPVIRWHVSEKYLIIIYDKKGMRVSITVRLSYANLSRTCLVASSLSGRLIGGERHLL